MEMQAAKVWEEPAAERTPLVQDIKRKNMNSTYCITNWVHCAVEVLVVRIFGEMWFQQTRPSFFVDVIKGRACTCQPKPHADIKRTLIEILETLNNVHHNVHAMR